MEDYFLNCHSEESIKIRYRKLSKEFHPDKNPDPNALAIIQEINDQRDKALKVLYKKSGLSDVDIEAKLHSFVHEFINGDTSNMNNVAQSLTEKFEAEHPGKELNFKNLFPFVIEELMGAVTSKNKKVNGAAGNGQIDKEPF
jgi:DnaJ-class molecular chaperone